MKKMYFVAFALLATLGAGAQKANVDLANKLSGKFDKLSEARQAYQAAIQDPETANDARTYFVAGKVEMDAYDKGFQAGMINPQDPSANPITMGEELLNAYNLFLQAMPLDHPVDKNGKEQKPKYEKDIVNKIAGHAADFFKSGAHFYEAKRYYPEAYQGFIIYASMPEMEFLGDKAPKLSDADRGQAYFNAALAAYSGNEVLKSADAFRASRQLGFDDPNAYIYEIACWQNLQQNDSTVGELAKERIMEVATDGYRKFGLQQPIFLNNMVNNLVTDGKFDEALASVDALIAENPDNSNLYGLRGFINDRAERDDQSVADYRKAASLESCDFETLKNAAKKIYRVGAVKFGALDMKDAAGKQAVKKEYFDVAKEITGRAQTLNPSDSDLQYVIENIDYALETYF